MESLMRLLIVLSGLPTPIPQAEIVDANGFFVARGDLKGPGMQAVFEYDGAIHNEPLNYAKDVTRWRNLRAADCKVLFYTARELFQSPQQNRHRLSTSALAAYRSDGCSRLVARVAKVRIPQARLR